MSESWVIVVLGVCCLIWVALFARMKKIEQEDEKERSISKEKIHSLEAELDEKRKDSEFASKWRNAPELEAEIRNMREECDDLCAEVSRLQALIDTDYAMDDSPSLESLRNMSFGIADAKCGEELDRAIFACDELIGSGKSVEATEDQSPIPKGAPALLLSAFNGYADAIIARLSQRSSYKKARRDISLAYYVTNARGEATLHARIAKSYLSAKLDVLRWTMAVNEYKRALREEDKNRRELECDEARSLAELRRKAENAKKEREIYEKALVAARAELHTAFSGQDKLRLENRIRELEAQLAEKDDEVKTLTAAQQGRQGTVYVISNVGSFGENVYKIGMTRRLDPQVRVNELNEASTPYPFDVHAFIRTSDAPSLELELHKRYQDNKINLVANSNAREFYRVDLPELRSYLESRGYSTRWKMEAEASEYRESEKIRGGYKTGQKETASLLLEGRSKADEHEKTVEGGNDERTLCFATADDLASAMRSQKIATVDNRKSGGRLWIASTNDSDAMLENARVAGKRIIKASKSHNFGGRPGWFVP